MFIFNHIFSGLPVSMLFGYIFSRRQYTPMQIVSPPYVNHVPPYSISSVQFSVVIVTAGVIMVTLSRTNPGTDSQTSKTISTENLRRYSLGIGMSTVSLFCTGLLGLLQERTYRKYGPCWREGVFYTVGAHSLPASRPLTWVKQHFLSLPVFLFLGGDVKQGIRGLVDPISTSSTFKAFVILLGNLIAQLMCVSGVNRLSSVGHSFFSTSFELYSFLNSKYPPFQQILP